MKPAHKAPALQKVTAGRSQRSKPAAQRCATVSRRASESIRDGHAWVYASEVVEVQADSAGLLPVVDNRGIPLGTALYSPTSQIPLRMVSRAILAEHEWLPLLSERIRKAILRRKAMLAPGSNAQRLVFSEADDLPGIIVDRYAGIVILQLLVKGLDTAKVREVCVQAIRDALGNSIETVWERPDPRIRELEGLSTPSTSPLWIKESTPTLSAAQFRLNGLSFQFDVQSGQKTGAFLDQSSNYKAVAAWATSCGAKKALDVCTYQGGFALHLAQVCESVTGVDSSHASLEVAERNLAANRKQLKAEVDWVEADAFELLRGWSESPEHRNWDLIVLDPPAFAKSKRAVEGALRGYKELDLRSLRMIRPGGLLVSCSCSHHVSWSDLESVMASAAVDAGRRVTLLERRGAALDHPVLLTLPETEYLKCIVCEVD